MPEPQYGEPWTIQDRIDKHSDEVKDLVDRAGFCPVTVGGWVEMEYVARIVACVNFCRYLSDEQIRGRHLRSLVAGWPSDAMTEEPVLLCREET